LGSAMLDEITAAGGTYLIGISQMLLDLKRMRVANVILAILLAPALMLLLYVIGAPVAP